MKTIFKLQRQKYLSESGFITLEILVSIFIASAFLAVSMQSLVYAMALKIQALEKNRANELITEQLERASQLGNSSALAGTCDAANYLVDPTILTPNGGFGNGLWIALNLNPPTPINPPPFKTLFSDGSGKTLALEATEVSAGGNSDPPHRSLRVLFQVWEWGPPAATPAAANDFLNSNGTIRTAGIDKPIAETYVEIIPDVALACP